MIAGAAALIVEEEFLIAFDLQRILEAHGATVVLIARTVAEAATHVRVGCCTLALVSIGPVDDTAMAFCRNLRDRGVALVAITAVGSHRDTGIPGLEGVPTIVKPFTDEDLVAGVAAAIGAAGAAPPAS